MLIASIRLSEKSLINGLTDSTRKIKLHRDNGGIFMTGFLTLVLLITLCCKFAFDVLFTLLFPKSKDKKNDDDEDE